MNAPRDAAAVRIPPPLVYAAGIVAGVLLQRHAAPLRLEPIPAARWTLAAALFVSGLGLVGGAARLFRRTGQDPKPWTPTPEIVSTGVYRYTRNPMYLAMALIQAAVGVALDNGWVIVLIAPALLVVYATAIRHEERYLEQKFGESYRRYRATVRRWF